MKNLIIFLILAFFLSSCDDLMRDITFMSENEFKAEETIIKMSGLMYNPVKNSEKLFAITSPKGTMRSTIISTQQMWLSKGDSLAVKFYKINPEEYPNGEIWVVGTTSTVRLSKGDTILVSGPKNFTIKMFNPTVVDSIWFYPKSPFDLFGL